VDTPAVTGAAAVSPDAVREAAALQDKQLWEVDTGKVAAAVEQIPGIRDVRVSKRWPDRVTIAVEERLPAAVWRIGAVDVVVDEDGYVLDLPVMGGMPAISQIDGQPGLGIGDRVDGDAVRLASMLTAQVPEAVGQRVARVEYTSNGGLAVVTDRNLRVRFGDGQNVDYKLDLWRAIAEQARKDKINPSAIDLRFGQWAAVR
ncbi:MAG: cell division protein FtsQ/DivIB, partial [Dehalococcoidia bacterium]